MNSHLELYQTKNTSSTMEKEWLKLQEKGEVTNCETCGTKIWKYWHLAKSERKAEKGIYPEMVKCAPCFFDNE